MGQHPSCSSIATMKAKMGERRKDVFRKKFGANRSGIPQSSSVARAKFYKPGLLLFLSKFSRGQCFAQVPAVAAHLNLPCHFVRWQRQAAACGPFSSVQLFRAEMAIDHLSGRRFLNECAICLGLAPLLLSPSLCARLRREQVP